MTNSTEASTAIQQIAAAIRMKGKQFPTGISEIPDIPFASFSELSSAVRDGAAILQRFSIHFDNNIFEMFASRLERNLNIFYIASAFLLPVASIVLGFFYSWWWLAAIPILFLALGRSKKLYNRVILSSALSSELYFCFLYATRQVSITTPDFAHSYYWEQREDAA